MKVMYEETPSAIVINGNIVTSLKQQLEADKETHCHHYHHAAIERIFDSIKETQHRYMAQR